MSPEFVDGNHLTLLNGGAEFFPALIAAIEVAEREVQIETYIFEDDASGRLVIDALKRAAARGVTARVLVDGFGAAAFGAPDSAPVALPSRSRRDITCSSLLLIRWSIRYACDKYPLAFIL